MRSLIILILLGVSTTVIAQSYKDMMSDPSINFYEVVAEAERYFSSIDRNQKGSGWKNFERWRNNNEYKYYPTGRRDNIDPLFPVKAYNGFLKSQPQSNRTTPNWTELGPSEVTSITGHYAAGLGRVEDFYVDPGNANNIYLGSRSGGFWKTTDGGASWSGGSTDFLTASGVNAIGVSPWNKDSILINIRNAGNGYSHGVYRSIDAGNSWSLTPFEPTNVGYGGLGSNFIVYTIEYHPDIADLIFVGTNKGLFRSTNNLQSWTQLITSADVTDIAFHPTDQDVMYLIDDSSVDRNYVWYSTDQGVTWSSSAELTGNNDELGWLAISEDCPNCVYFGSDEGIWKSSNQALTFSLLTTVDGCDAIAVNGNDKNNIIYAEIDTHTSSNEGSSFNQTTWWSLGNGAHGSGSFQDKFENSTAYAHADIRTADWVNGVFYTGTDGFLCKSVDNGMTWEYISQGTAIRENYKLGVSQSNHDRTILGSQDNGTTILHESGWIEYYGADGMECIIHPLNPDWMISSIQYGGRRRTINAGQSGTGISPPGQNGSGNAYWIAPFAFDPNQFMRVYNFSSSVYVSEDFGSSWAYRGAPTTFTAPIKRAAIAENNSDIIVIAKDEFIEKSTDAGATFSDIKNNLPTASITDIAFDPNDDDTFIVTYARYQNDGNKVFITTNGGTSWTNITYNLNNMPVRCAVIDHTTDKNIYLGTEIGVFTKTMAGNTWTLYNSSLPNVTVRELEINYSTNTLRAATWGRGLWEISLDSRSTYPAILNTSITNPPTDVLPLAGVDQFVTSNIDYSGTLTNVYLEWSQNSNVLGNSITMSNTGGNTWVSDTPIPNFPNGTKIYFKVFAEGSSGDNTETYRFMYIVGGALPVELVHFSAIAENNKRVLLNWQTASELNNDYFSVERSVNINQWEELMQVQGALNSSILQTYEVVDEAPYKGTSYYRLKQFDLDGKFSYSPIESVHISNLKSNGIRIFPNPFKDQIWLEGERLEIESFSIYNLIGQQISTPIDIIEQTDRSYLIDLSKIPNGIYILKTKNHSGKVIKM